MMHYGMGFGGQGGTAFLGPVVFILVFAVLGYALYYILGKEKKGKMRDLRNLNDTEILVLAAAALLLLVVFGGGIMGVGMGLGLLFWVVVIFLAYYLITDRKTATDQESALDILDKRYVGGEISREEYLEMKKEIMES